MSPRRGLQAEILVSLAVLMITAPTVLGVLLARSHQASGHRLHQLAARALVDDLDASNSVLARSIPKLFWWVVDSAGEAVPRNGHAEQIDDESRELAAEARDQNRALLKTGSPWTPLRFAAPVPGESFVAVALLPAAVSPGTVLAILLGDVLIFTAFGAYVLRRRLVLPLEKLAAAARSITDGGTAVRAPEEGTLETVELGRAFNEMTETLERRSSELEKAVVDLRASNRDLRKAREGLDRAGRLAAVGRLAAGVAHEVGNPMGAMLAFIDLARRDSGLSDDGRQHLQRAGEEGQRVRGILRQLLDFSSPRRTEREPVDLIALCQETAILVSAQRRYKRITLKVEAEGRPPPLASTDRNTVKQIILNLLLNAGDALNERSEGGHITVRVRSAVGQLRAGERPAFAAGRRTSDVVECVVADDGPGIPEENRGRIFDPFFTTKDPGEGTGLGLANAARSAEELGGRLELAEPSGNPGAEFVLQLPAVTGEEGVSRVRG